VLIGGGAEETSARMFHHTQGEAQG